MYTPYPRKVRFHIRHNGLIRSSEWHQIGGIAFQPFGHRKESVILMARHDAEFLELTCDVIRRRKRIRGKWSEDPARPSNNYMLKLRMHESGDMLLMIDWKKFRYNIQFYEPDGGLPEYGKMQATFTHRFPIGRRMCPLFHRSVKTIIQTF